MRYTCLKTIVTKIFDGIIEDPEDILNVLQVIKEKELTCAMQVKNSPMYESVRILEINDDCITWRLLKDGTSLKKKSKIVDIITMQVHTNDDLMIQLKPKPSRWSILDASDI